MRKKITLWALILALLLTLTTPAAAVSKYAGTQDPAGDEVVELIVELDRDPLLLSGDTEDELAALTAEQDRLLEEIAAMLPEGEVEEIQRYVTALNAVAVSAPFSLLEGIAELEGVAQVSVASRFEPEDLITDAATQPDQYSPISVAEMADLVSAHEMGLDGTGVVIAVIDTGIDLDHPAFSAKGMDTDKAAISPDIIRAKLGRLNAGRTVSQAGSVYHSAKIPFAYDYSDYSTDVSHPENASGDHGTAVAAAAAGVETAECAAGAAPGAQLLVMKVFSDNTDGASEIAILAALEDAATLGADIVNLSLGTISGFSYGLTAYSKTVQNLAKSGIVVCAAAGNEYNAAYGNNTRRAQSTSDNIDNGIFSEPAGLDGVLSVGSVNSDQYYAEGFLVEKNDGKNIIISVNDTGELYGLRSFTDLLEVPGHEDGVYEYAVVPGIGTEEDYAQVDVKGRIALVERGEITFVEKSENAFARGALGVIVYNNVDENINMDMTAVSEENDLPCVIISKSDGEKLVEAADEDGVGTLTVLSGTRLVVSPDGWRPSSTSSWGPLSDLTLKPEVVAVGGNVYTASNGGTYATVSGTSMASPQAAGSVALLLQYVKETYKLSGSKACLRAQTLLMNTAKPILQEDGVEYSPRKQGAGFITAGNAVTTPIYATVNGSQLPKAELGDDKKESGVYSFTFTVSNSSDREVCYVLHSSALTEGLDSIYMRQEDRRLEHTSVWAGDGVNALYETDEEGNVVYRDVNGDGIITLMDTFLLNRAILRQEQGLSGDRTVTVPANGKSEVTVTIRLTDEEKKQLRADYKNGAYVEGYIYLDPMDVVSPELSIPMLAFFGDWSKAPLFSLTSYAELNTASAAGKLLGNSPDGYMVTTGAFNYLGENPVAQEEVYIPERSNAVSMSEGNGGYLGNMALDLYRNAKEVKVEVISGGKVLYESVEQNLVKSHFLSDESRMTSVLYPLYFNPKRNGLKDGDTFTIRVTGVKAAEGAYSTESFEIPGYLDGTAPEFESVTVSREDGKTVLKVAVRDNFYTAGFLAYIDGVKKEIKSWAANQETCGETLTMELDVSDLRELSSQGITLVASDYAGNKTSYRVIFD